MALLQYHGMNVLSVGLKEGGVVQLLPGVNEVDDEKFEVIKGHPHFAARMRDGKITVLSVPSKEGDGKQSVEEMLGYIPKIFDTKLLKKLIKSDGRKPVVDAAQKQLDLIAAPKKPQEKEDEHFS